MKLLILCGLSLMVKYIATSPTTPGVTDATGSINTTKTTDTSDTERDEMYTPPHDNNFLSGFTMHTGKVKTPPSFLLSTTGIPPETTLLDRYIFESVDYEEIPQKLKDEYHDCYGQHIRCVRHRTDHFPVCGFNLVNSFYSDYYGPCEIDLQNCYHRMKNGFGVYGTDYKNDIIFYNGEGYNCIYYTRMAKTKEEMDELYFGDEINRLQRNKKRY